MKRSTDSSVYNHRVIEAKWQEAWSSQKTDVAPISSAKRPYYNLMMFPYPSAEGLHVGNMYAFTGTDIFGRFKRMQGYDVFEPIGLDGFGIHSENYAFKVGTHPVDQAKRSEENFYRQLHLIGSMYDWTRTVETYDPSYYRWTQWLFVQMFRHGLAYRSTADVNWCPSCKTVLADEQVIDGACERCGNKVEKRALEQWFFRITAYAEKLLKNISKLKWSEKVLIAQRNWIGKKEGIEITYPVLDSDEKEVGSITCYTTRPDTNFGATFMVVAPEHEFITRMKQVIKPEKMEKIAQYKDKAAKTTPDERIAQGRKKTGVDTGLFALNQLTGHKIPIYVSDFVVLGVGTGVVVGVPGHDVRDFEFAQAMNIPVKRVVVGADGESGEITSPDQVQEEEGTMVNSGFLDGMDIQKAIGAMMDHLEQKGWGKRVTTYHLRDWLISRQRYWGPPIPMIHCKACESAGKGERDDMPGWYTVSDADLPVVLPRIDDYKPGDDGIAPLAKHKEFYETVCPGCGKTASRETDVSDTFLDSSWYFLRYPSVGSETADINPFDPEITKHWLPVDMYTGGAEHSVLHLMYSRFVTMALKDWGYLDFEEPFPNFFAHGLVIKEGAKMSKSKGNVVNPDEYIKLYGTDALRMYLMFMGPFSEGGDFRDSGMEGMSRWIKRVWRMATASLKSSAQETDSADVIKLLHHTVKKVGEDTERRHYNTAIASMMEFTNCVADHDGTLTIGSLKTFLRILAPYAPHITEELWHMTGGTGSIHHESWPEYDKTQLVEATVTVVVQVNGKLRDSMQFDVKTSTIQAQVEAAARASKKVQKYIHAASTVRVVFVPGKLVNFVIPS